MEYGDPIEINNIYHGIYMSIYLNVLICLLSFQRKLSADVDQDKKRVKKIVK